MRTWEAKFIYQDFRVSIQWNELLCARSCAFALTMEGAKATDLEWMPRPSEAEVRSAES